MREQTHRSQITLILAVAVVSVFFAGCLTSSRVSELGDEEAKKVEESMGLVENEKLVAYVSAVGHRLVALSDLPHARWSFLVVATAEPNAFALPGGHIYVSRGLLALINSEDELAGVIGHEIGHVTANHTVKRLRASAATAPLAIASGIAGAAVGVVSPALGNVVGGVGQVLTTGFVVAPFSRAQEREADEIGQVLAAKAGYDPPALAIFLGSLDRDEKLQGGKARNQSIMDYHPMTPARVEALTQRAESLERGSPRPVAKNRADLLARLDGIVVGEDPANGVFSDEVFLHPVFDLSLAFPPGWKTANSPQAVGAVSPSKDAVIAMSVASAGSTLDEFLKKLKKGNPKLEFERLEINGLAAARTILSGHRVEHVTLIEHKSHLFSVVGRTSVGRAAQYAHAFDAVGRSFEPLSLTARNSIEESRLRVREAREGETPADVSQRVGATWTGDQIAVANAVASGESLPAKKLLKVALPQPFQAPKR